MAQSDRLIKKAKPKPTIQDKLKENNPYLGKSDEELLDYLSGDNYRAPEKNTRAWEKFMFALISAPHKGGLEE